MPPPVHTYIPVLQTAHTHTPTHILLCNIISGLSSCWELLNPSQGKHSVGRITSAFAHHFSYFPLLSHFFSQQSRFKASVLMFSSIQSLAFTLDKIFILVNH